VVIDTSVWFNGRTCAEAILALGAGLADGHWSAQIVGELTRTRLWVGKLDQGRRPVSEAEYLAYRERQYELISEIDEVCGIRQAAGTEPTPGELTWAAADHDDLHVQLFARTVGADYVVSANTRHFPNPRRIRGKQRGELEGVVWITPDQIF
jgi:hypothetical protein